MARLTARLGRSVQLPAHNEGPSEYPGHHGHLAEGERIRRAGPGH